jgi:hypothetical protein
MVAVTPKRPPQRFSRAHFATRLVRIAELVGYTEADGAALAATRDLIAPRIPAIADRAQRLLAAQPEIAAYLAPPAHTCFDGSGGGFREWLEVAVEGKLDESLAEYLTDVGRVHTKRAGRSAVRVNARYLVAAMSLVEQAIVGELDRRVRNRRELMRAVPAWSKLLTIHLDLMLAVYGSAESNPHWY